MEQDIITDTWTRRILLAINGVGHYQDKSDQKIIKKKGTRMLTRQKGPEWYQDKRDQNGIKTKGTRMVSRPKGPEWYQDNLPWLVSYGVSCNKLCRIGKREPDAIKTGLWDTLCIAHMSWMNNSNEHNGRKSDNTGIWLLCIWVSYAKGAVTLAT